MKEIGMKELMRNGKPLSKVEQKRYDTGLGLFMDLQARAKAVQGVIFYDNEPIRSKSLYKIQKDGSVQTEYTKYSSEMWIDLSGRDCICLDYPTSSFKKTFNSVLKIWKEIK